MKKKKEGDFLDDELLKNIPEEYRFFLQDMDEDPFFPYPFREDIEGPISLGVVPGTMDIFGIFPEELNQHLLFSGRSGSGKTNTNRVIFTQLYSHVPCWFVDFKKDYRHLLTYTKDILVIGWKSLRINPLRPPPGTDPLKWIQLFSDFFSMSFGLMSASKSLIIEILEDLYEKYGVFKGDDLYPTMFEFHELLERKSMKKGLAWDLRGYITRSMNKTTVCVKIMKNTFDCDKGFPLEDLLDKNVVFELDGLMDELQTFMVNLILAWVFTYRLENR